MRQSQCDSTLSGEFKNDYFCKGLLQVFLQVLYKFTTMCKINFMCENNVEEIS